MLYKFEMLIYWKYIIYKGVLSKLNISNFKSTFNKQRKNCKPRKLEENNNKKEQNVLDLDLKQQNQTPNSIIKT